MLLCQGTFNFYPITSRESVEVFKHEVNNPLYYYWKIIGMNVGEWKEWKEIGSKETKKT